MNEIEDLIKQKYHITKSGLIFYIPFIIMAAISAFNQQYKIILNITIGLLIPLIILFVCFLHNEYMISKLTLSVEEVHKIIDILANNPLSIEHYIDFVYHLRFPLRRLERTLEFQNKEEIVKGNIYCFSACVHDDRLKNNSSLMNEICKKINDRIKIKKLATIDLDEIEENVNQGKLMEATTKKIHRYCFNYFHLLLLASYLIFKIFCVIKPDIIINNTVLNLIFNIGADLIAVAAITITISKWKRD